MNDTTINLLAEVREYDYNLYSRLHDEFFRLYEEIEGLEDELRDYNENL